VNVDCYERGLLWLYYAMKGSGMNVGLFWMWCVMVCGVLWSVMNKASYERGLLSTSSEMNGSVMNVVYYDVWSIMKGGLLW